MMALRVMLIVALTVALTAPVAAAPVPRPQPRACSINVVTNVVPARWIATRGRFVLTPPRWVRYFVYVCR